MIMRKRLIGSVLPLALIVAPLSAITSACCGSSAAASKASGSGGCSGGGSSVQSCSPYAEDKNGFGKIAVQQKGPQQPVAWGVYPIDPAGVFKVTITVDDQVYDDKPSQPYPPHGSVKVDASSPFSRARTADSRLRFVIARCSICALSNWNMNMLSSF
jgi:hypothetical protein